MVNWTKKTLEFFTRLLSFAAQILSPDQVFYAEGLKFYLIDIIRSILQKN